MRFNAALHAQEEWLRGRFCLEPRWLHQNELERSPYLRFRLISRTDLGFMSGELSVPT